MRVNPRACFSSERESAKIRAYMKRFVEKYESWSEMGKNLFILIVVAVIGALISLVFLVADNVGVLLGWLLGSAVNILAYVSICKGSSRLLSTSGSAKQGYFAILWAFLRLFLYAGSLLLAGFASFKWGTLAHGYCNLIAVALALMPTWIVLVLSTLSRNRKTPKEEPKPVEAPKEENEGNE